MPHPTDSTHNSVVATGGGGGIALHTAPLVHRPTSRSLAHSRGIARCPISTVYHKEVVLESFLSVNILQH